MSIKSILILLLIVGGVYYYLSFTGDNADSLIADIDLSRVKDGGHLDIHFTSPVRYLGHFPENHGDVVQIKLRAISFGGIEKNYSIANKLLAAGKIADYGIDELRYEGDVPGGPFIVVRFSKPMNFEVKEGTGLRSLLLNYKKR